eukprot:TRINITY_DN14264_c0_g1_i1.p1 TRINITY_DN14264_c0_g1~~TRINITY_DN14264_c0_g1_i1.p1  ORF type:complete len:471 (+),score=155.39 TRINITY_DN14264_c0_g1_i1:72-1415(+)
MLGLDYDSDEGEAAPERPPPPDRPLPPAAAGPSEPPHSVLPPPSTAAAPGKRPRAEKGGGGKRRKRAQRLPGPAGAEGDELDELERELEERRRRRDNEQQHKEEVSGVASLLPAPRKPAAERMREGRAPRKGLQGGEQGFELHDGLQQIDTERLQSRAPAACPPPPAECTVAPPSALPPAVAPIEAPPLQPAATPGVDSAAAEEDPLPVPPGVEGGDTGAAGGSECRPAAAAPSGRAPATAAAEGPAGGTRAVAGGGALRGMKVKPTVLQFTNCRRAPAPESTWADKLSAAPPPPPPPAPLQQQQPQQSGCEADADAAEPDDDASSDQGREGAAEGGAPRRQQEGLSPAQLRGLGLHGVSPANIVDVSQDRLRAHTAQERADLERSRLASERAQRRAALGPEPSRELHAKHQITALGYRAALRAPDAAHQGGLEGDARRKARARYGW